MLSTLSGIQNTDSGLRRTFGRARPNLSTIFGLACFMVKRWIESQPDRRKALFRFRNSSPVLERLGANNYIKRNQSDKDEREVKIKMTYQENFLRQKLHLFLKKINFLLNQWKEEELLLSKTQVNKLIQTLKH